MKAKTYAEQFIAAPTPETLGKIAKDMLVETSTLAEARHAKSNEALISILNEAIDKWRAFVREVSKKVKVEGIREDGLKRLIIKDFPFIPQHLLK